MACAQLRKAIHPTRRHAVRGRRINNARLLRRRQGVHHGDRLTGRIVMQTKNNQIGFLHQLALGGRVFAALGRNAQHLHRRHQGQSLPNLQASGSGFTINKNFGHRALHRSHLTRVSLPTGRPAVSLAKGFVQGTMIQLRFVCPQAICTVSVAVY